MAVSYWMESCGDDLTRRDPLDGSVDVDVAILGAGFTGLWTAYYLQRRDPSLRVAVVEAEFAGFGASGRNGGWCTSGFGAGPDLLRERFGVDAARGVHEAMVDTVDEVGARSGMGGCQEARREKHGNGADVGSAVMAHAESSSVRKAAQRGLTGFPPAPWRIE